MTRKLSTPNARTSRMIKLPLPPLPHKPQQDRLHPLPELKARLAEMKNRFESSGRTPKRRPSRAMVSTVQESQLAKSGLREARMLEAMHDHRRNSAPSFYPRSRNGRERLSGMSERDREGRDFAAGRDMRNSDALDQIPGKIPSQDRPSRHVAAAHRHM